MRKYEIPEMKISMFDETVNTSGSSYTPVEPVSYNDLREITQYRFD